MFRHLFLVFLAKGMLGSGAYGSVRIQDGMAVKKFHDVSTLRKMHPGRKNIPDITTPSFLRECAALCYLSELPGVVQIQEFDATKMEIGMELCRTDLRSWMQENHGKNQYFDRALLLIQQMIRALVSLHDRGLVHGDFKMSNILITNGGEAILGDMGFASIAAYSAVYHTADHYRDPAMRAHSCHDVYSFACTAYQLMSGKPIHYREKDGSRRSFTYRELRARIERHIPPDYRTELLAMVNSDCEARPSLRKVYSSWFREDITVWEPDSMYIVPKQYPRKNELEHAINEGRKEALKHKIERYDTSAYALCYYMSEKSSEEYRPYVAALLLLTHSCFHLRKKTFDFTLHSACVYGKCSVKVLRTCIEELLLSREFLQCFYWDYTIPVAQ